MANQQKIVIQIPKLWKARIASNAGRGLIPAGLVRANFHRITVEGFVTMHDYETFGPNEEGTFAFRKETNLSTQGPSSTLLQWEQGFGGEERTEIDIIGALNNDGVCRADIAVRFYEGATEGTNELEDSRVHTTIVPVNTTSNFEIRLANDEDDWARIVGSISNVQF